MIKKKPKENIEICGVLGCVYQYMMMVTCKIKPRSPNPSGSSVSFRKSELSNVAKVGALVTGACGCDNNVGAATIKKEEKGWEAAHVDR